MELLEVYNNEGNPTGRVVQRGDKSAVFSENEHIAVGVIFIENSKGEFLIQKTSKEKEGKFSSTGGHITKGETPLTSIVREVKEELGIDINKEDVVELGYLLYDRPIRFMFYIKQDIDLDKIVLQQEEVEYVEYMTVEQIKSLIKEGLTYTSHAKMFEKVLEYKQKKNI